MKSSHRNVDGTPKYTNRLANETSPYLRDHAHNPVDWYAWGEEAFKRAQHDHKPVHLSVGYAACHWCHILAAESFENEDTARFLNEHFINIKVDREERPDIDRIYQIAQQMLTQRSGGWPLTMFLTPDDQRPFLAVLIFLTRRVMACHLFARSWSASRSITASMRLLCVSRTRRWCAHLRT